MQTTLFDYHLPPERIAQYPIEPRHNARLLVLDRERNERTHSFFYRLGDFLNAGDVLVINQTRVIPARIFAHKATGGRVEILLLKRETETRWEALVGGKKVHSGARLQLVDGPVAWVVESMDGARRMLEFERPLEDYLTAKGQMPLPPYIHKRLNDPERYQTVYGNQLGSAAAPTAGLHFTPQLISQLTDQGIQFARITLHVGLDTFAPVNEDDPREHQIHSEWCELTAETAQQINDACRNGGRVVAVGTTSVRTLESAAAHADRGERVGAFSGNTRLYILPGYTFQSVDAMITNFHLPRSTLLMLVSAFAGRERMLEVYAEAIREEYRFYSFGDAMLIK